MAKKVYVSPFTPLHYTPTWERLHQGHFRSFELFISPDDHALLARDSDSVILYHFPPCSSSKTLIVYRTRCSGRIIVFRVLDDDYETLDYVARLFSPSRLAYAKKVPENLLENLPGIEVVGELPVDGHLVRMAVSLLG